MPVTITLEQLAHHVRIDLSADVDDPTRLILADLLNSTLRILSSVSERGCNSMVQGSRKFLDISVGSG